MPEAGGSALLSPSLPFPAGCEEHHYLQNTKNASNSLLVLFSLDPVPSGLSRLDLLHCRSVSSGHLLLQVAGRWTMELLVCGRWLKETARWLAGRSCYRCGFLRVWPAAVDGDELPPRGEGSVSWAQGATAGLWAQPCVGRS
ncbi:hypothetical protein POPTR_019G014392v4 [Populus trichocarpa]|uniref:Uncharacterized protein n=3 Tax=Populus trichocarpa TaxID=3694 RepID=U7E1R6_POPTR|nr:hypothetical protein POPTR_019G014394v4 [Populus trichocarpa]KAI9377057.1 hypothetical protein POPTR_019G014392v4 [Populus trichocarpa]